MALRYCNLPCFIWMPVESTVGVQICVSPSTKLTKKRQKKKGCQTYWCQIIMKPLTDWWKQFGYSLTAHCKLCKHPFQRGQYDQSYKATMLSDAHNSHREIIFICECFPTELTSPSWSWKIRVKTPTKHSTEPTRSLSYRSIQWNFSWLAP